MLIRGLVLSDSRRLAFGSLAAGRSAAAELASDRRSRILARTLLLGAIVLGACGGGAQPSAAPRPAASVGDPARGEQVFTTAAQPTCAGCHALKGVSEGQIGPDLTHIATEAVQRVVDPGYKGKAKDTAAYIRESITDPNAFIAPKCPNGTCFRDLMPKDFAQKLTRQQLEDLVAYLLAQK